MLKQTHLDENSGLVNECLLVCTMRWMQEKVMHIIGVAHAMKQAIIGKQSQYMPTKLTRQHLCLAIAGSTSIGGCIR